MFVYLEGSWHPMGENETTVCGIVVPHGSEWVRDVPPDKVHRDDLTEPIPPKPSVVKPKAKKG